MAERLRIALFISGAGTTAREILKACYSGVLENVDPACVIASKAGIQGIKRITDEGMMQKDVCIVDPKKYKGDQEGFGNVILNECRERGVQFVGLYGWLPMIPVNVIEEYPGMMVNQHPGPLDPGRPDFGGKGMFGIRVHCARLLFVRATQRDYWTEAVSQRVGVGFDEGEVLRRRRIDIKSTDDPHSLQLRLFKEEYIVQIDTLRDFASGSPGRHDLTVPLVRDGEEDILRKSKEVACQLYPS